MTSSTVKLSRKLLSIPILIFLLIFVLSATAFAEDIPVTSLTVEQDAISLAVGKSLELNPTVLPEDATDKTLIFKSSDTEILLVENNKITAQKAGTATVTASWSLDETINTVYTVTTFDGNISFQDAKVYTNVAEPVTLTLVQTPEVFLSNDEIVYASSNPNIATVENGVVTPISRGVATISAASTDGLYSASCEVIVAGITITTNVDALELVTGDTHALKTTVLGDPNVVDTYTYTWTTSDENVMTVSSDGTISCNNIGEATITVTCNENPTVTTSANIKVCGIKLDAYSKYVYMYNNFDLNAEIITNKTVTDSTVIWSSSDLSIATVINGSVTVVSSGSCLITATNSETGYSTSCSVNISPHVIESNVYNVDRSLKSIVNIPAGTNFAQFKASLINFSNHITITNVDGSTPEGNIILSGMKINLVVDGTQKDSLNAIVNGDINGDGKITISDYTLLKLHILNLKKIDKQYNLVSADTNFDNAISIADYTLIRLDILNIKQLNDGLNALPDISNSSTKKLVETALAQYGKPYSWGDEGPDKFDCSGLVYYCVNKSGTSIIRSTAHSYSNYTQWATVNKTNLQPGDLMFFKSDSNPNKIGHVGIYLNDGYFIHASGSYSNVVISKFTGYYDTMFSHGKRVYQ